MGTSPSSLAFAPASPTPAPTPPSPRFESLFSQVRDLPDDQMIELVSRLLEHRRKSRPAGTDRAALTREVAWTQRLDERTQRHLNLLGEHIYSGKHPKHWLWRSHKQWIMDHAKPGERVLDVGCGASAYLLWMAEKGCKVTACDINPARIEQAKGIMSHPNLAFEVRDVMKQRPQREFDVVICSHVIEHLEDPIGMLQALRANAPRLLVAVPPDDNRWQKVMYRDLGLLWKDDEDHRREYTPALLRAQLEGAGWRVTQMHPGVDIKAECICDAVGTGA